VAPEQKVRRRAGAQPRGLDFAFVLL